METNGIPDLMRYFLGCLIVKLIYFILFLVADLF